MKEIRIAKERGQDLVEFAVALPVLLLLLLVIIDLGRITYAYSALHNAVREGARYGVIHYDDPSGVEDFARSYAIGLDNSLSALNISAVYSLTDETITVVGTYDFKTASPILRLIFNDDSFELRAVSLMLTEE